jgi:predicted ArsR family transcriptional regulator
MTKNLDRDADRSLSAARALSKLLYGGAQYRVEVGAAIAEALATDKMVNTAELADDLSLTRQAVGHELNLFEQAGLLQRTDAGSGRKVYFLIQPSSYWDWCKEARQEAATMIDRFPRY